MKFSGSNSPKKPKKPQKKSIYHVLDSKSKTYSSSDKLIRQKKTKPNSPIYTTNPNDPRIRNYNDSMFLHNSWKGSIDALRNVKTMKGKVSNSNQLFKKSGEGEGKVKKSISAKKYYTKVIKTAMKTDPVARRLKAVPERDFSKDTYEGGLIAWEYAKPVQPVVYVKPQKPITKKEVKKKKSTYKKSTGKTYKVKNKGIKALKKKLGRNPTVAEYNKWMKNKS